MPQLYERFDDYPRNGEGMSVYEPEARDRYPAGTALLFHINTDAAYLSVEDIERLHAALGAFLDAR
ncbi:hypothetical protein PBI_THONKO_2 [Mycobacterium phage Thonko]|uniref:Uncharacterized protein n=1 Tax=Mycobacterium phage Thonko TaxID=2282910 RepID=A0A346FC49_9CAUD|nr:hypothetical protein I5G57_gp002 [Mycobacterium phage Thonko]AXN53274.1 hypothetical protein PBI_THONKO_2 [Mycobacterium phage Thonko]